MCKAQTLHSLQLLLAIALERLIHLSLQSLSQGALQPRPSLGQALRPKEEELCNTELQRM